jgi:hypothetical protein
MQKPEETTRQKVENKKSKGKVSDDEKMKICGC